MPETDENPARALLRWYAEMGVDESVSQDPSGLYGWGACAPGAAAAPSSTTRSSNNGDASADDDLTPSADEAIAEARRLAAGAKDVDALEAALLSFDGCQLKKAARNTVFADGVRDADLLIIGEAPGRDEDRLGKPFVGRAGQLLDLMLAAIGRSRTTDTLISNVVYWRPPANRAPTREEIEICRPFVERMIELVAPKAIVLAGGAPTEALLGLKGIMRARGVWRELELSSGARFPALPIFHPAFLLRQPTNKRLAWADLLSLEAKLKGEK
ncbi:MAG: uracil-DNA glycosylase [Pseudomonadota bacterium]